MSGTCMFAWECIRREGVRLGTCSEGFLFGVCCSSQEVANKKIPQPPENSAPVHNNELWFPGTYQVFKPQSSPSTNSSKSAKAVVENVEDASPPTLGDSVMGDEIPLTTTSEYSDETTKAEVITTTSGRKTTTYRWQVTTRKPFNPFSTPMNLEETTTTDQEIKLFHDNIENNLIATTTTSHPQEWTRRVDQREKVTSEKSSSLLSDDNIDSVTTIVTTMTNEEAHQPTTTKEGERQEVDKFSTTTPITTSSDSIVSNTIPDDSQATTTVTNVVLSQMTNASVSSTTTDRPSVTTPTPVSGIPYSVLSTTTSCPTTKMTTTTDRPYMGHLGEFFFSVMISYGSTICHFLDQSFA